MENGRETRRITKERIESGKCTVCISMICNRNRDQSDRNRAFSRRIGSSMNLVGRTSSRR